LDGAFAEQPDGPPRFVQLPTLASSDVAELLVTTRTQLLRLLATRGVIDSTQDLTLHSDVACNESVYEITMGSANRIARGSAKRTAERFVLSNPDQKERSFFVRGPSGVSKQPTTITMKSTAYSNVLKPLAPRVSELSARTQRASEPTRRFR
jgi:hypothetical protein